MNNIALTFLIFQFSILISYSQVTETATACDNFTWLDSVFTETGIHENYTHNMIFETNNMLQYVEGFMGYSVSLSDNGEIIAIGAPNSSSAKGKVVILKQNENDTWDLEEIIYGIDTYDHCGYSVSLSGAGDILAIGCPGYLFGVNSDLGVTGNGLVRVYQKTNNQWIQIGDDINPSDEGDLFASSISLSSNGDVIAIGAPSNSGKIFTYSWDNNTSNWLQIGQIITGEANDFLGRSVSLSPDGNILAASFNGQDIVKVFELFNDNWLQLGNDLPIVSTGTNWYYAMSQLSLSFSGDTICVGSPHYYNPDAWDGMFYGKVDVYEFDQEFNDWSQIGNSMIGLGTYSQFGTSVSLSHNGSRIAVGASSPPSNYGRASVYNLNDNYWQRITGDFNSNENILYSLSVDISKNGDIVAFGAPKFNSTGQTQIFSIDEHTLDLTINNSTTFYKDTIVCNTDTFNWNNGSYFASDTLYFSSTDVFGCDSNIVLNLSLNEPVYSLQNITECQEFEWNGEIYDSSGVYIFNTYSNMGCDSIAKLNLTISDPQLTIIESWGDLYLYENVSFSTWNTGENGISITPEENGLYWCVATIDGCIADTAFYQVDWFTTSNLENHSNTTFKIFPNPSEGKFNVSFDMERKQDVYLSVSNSLGEIVFSKKLNNNKQDYLTIDLEDNCSGIYILNIRTTNINLNKKIVIN